MSDADWIEEALAEYKYEVHDDLRRDIVIDLRQAYAAHLAQVDHDKLAERIAEKVKAESERVYQASETGDRWPTLDLADVRPIAQELLAPILAHNAAMKTALRECATNIHMICKSNYQSQLLVHIDQLTAKGAGQ